MKFCWHLDPGKGPNRLRIAALLLVPKPWDHGYLSETCFDYRSQLGYSGVDLADIGSVVQDTACRER